MKKSKKIKVKKSPPFEFIFDLLEGLTIRTKPMFGCLAIYSGEKILIILRDKGADTSTANKSKPVSDRDDGVWIATFAEHHASLKKEFADMRSLEMFGPGPTDWQVLPKDSLEFEESVTRLCELIMNKDQRIGKIPNKKRKKV